MSDALQDRYAAVERLYSQGQWDQVLEASAALLQELPQQPGDPVRTRLQLLQGHTQLYGLGQIAAAAAIYEQVLADQPEAVLQAIAQQELARCQQELATTPVATEQPAASTMTPAPASAAAPVSQAFPFTAQAMGTAPADQAVSAMPWLEAMGGVDPAKPMAAASPQASPWSEALGSDPKQSATSEPAVVDEQPALVEPEAAAEPEPLASEASVAEQTAISTPEPEAQAAMASADVIEEPEQIEVQQADQQSAELIDLEPVAPPSRWSPAEEAELAKGLLSVVLR